MKYCPGKELRADALTKIIDQDKIRRAREEVGLYDNDAYHNNGENSAKVVDAKGARHNQGC